MFKRRAIVLALGILAMSGCSHAPKVEERREPAATGDVGSVNTQEKLEPLSFERLVEFQMRTLNVGSPKAVFEGILKYSGSKTTGRCIVESNVIQLGNGQVAIFTVRDMDRVTENELFGLTILQGQPVPEYRIKNLNGQQVLELTRTSKSASYFHGDGSQDETRMELWSQHLDQGVVLTGKYFSSKSNADGSFAGSVKQMAVGNKQRKDDYTCRIVERIQ